MARKITVNMYMTLDGYGEFPEYPGSDIIQDEPDEFWMEMWAKRYESVDTLIYGRNSYLGHAQVHALSKRKKTDPEFLFDFSRFIERCQLIVLSKSLQKTEWGNTRLMKGNLEEIVADLRAEKGNDIIVDAGPSLVHEFMKKGLTDDYRIVVFPVIYGKGNHYWGSMLNQLTLKLLSVKSLPYGELYMHYETMR